IAFSNTVEYKNIVLNKPDDYSLSNNEIFAFNGFFKELLEEFYLPKDLKVNISFINRDNIKKINGINREFVEGFAVPSQNKIYILLPLKFTDFPINNLDNLIYHEMVHIVLYQYMRGKPIPYWLNEGLAQYLANNQPGNMRFSMSVVLKRFPEFKNISDRSFYKKPFINYPYSYYFVKYLDEKYGFENLLKFLKSFKVSQDISSNFLSVYEHSMSYDELKFHLYLKNQISFVIIFTPQFFFTLGSFILTLAYIIYLIRRKKILKKLAAEEDE
ncbi:hypothetical protein J7L48_06700, partial [bacterium]|nr:hypothetical protein [bacterium]